ncbi:hypothetical protein CLIB1423_10S03202 [[Candida] railenensis]|uniref:Zn(2)-C6 fungal-type domain-containing protein n=1 Tax=[Candida] railenensis TaxID=45579 RepID=A0A9P0QRD6_9ASCO|nr:hypothetical protein CLIB1423_10S03202 [[Candida] railenensis]
MKRKGVLSISDIVSAAEENPKEETEQQASPVSSKEAPKHRAELDSSQLSSRSTSHSQSQERSHNSSHEGYNMLVQPPNVQETHMSPETIRNNQDPRYIRANPPLILTMSSPSSNNLIYPQSAINVTGTMLLPVNSYNHVALPIYRPNFMQQNSHQQQHQQVQYQGQLQLHTSSSQFNGQQQQLLQQHRSEQRQHQPQIEHRHYQFDRRQQQQESQPQLQLQQPQQQMDQQMQHLQQQQLQQVQHEASPLHRSQALNQHSQRLQLLEHRSQEQHRLQQEQLHHHETLHLQHQQQVYSHKEKDIAYLTSQSHKVDNPTHEIHQNKRKNSSSTRANSEIGQGGSTPKQKDFEHQLRLEGTAPKHRNSCTRCRKLKKKCDKQEFQCQNCRKFSLSCVYLPRKQRKRGERRRRKQQNSSGLEGDISGGKKKSKLESNNEVR